METRRSLEGSFGNEFPIDLQPLRSYGGLKSQDLERNFEFLRFFGKTSHKWKIFKILFRRIHGDIDGRVV